MSHNALLAAVDELVALVESLNGPEGQTYHADTSRIAEISRLDAQVGALAQRCGIAIPSSAMASAYRPFGATQIPHRQSDGGQLFVATKNWRQAMNVLRALVDPSARPIVNYPKPTVDPPPPGVVEAAKRAVPAIMADVEWQSDGGVWLIAVQLIHRVRKAGHVQAAAEWAVFELVRCGILRVERVTWHLPIPKRAPRSPGSLWGGKIPSVEYDVIEGTPSGYDGFKLFATPKLSEWWARNIDEHGSDAQAPSTQTADTDGETKSVSSAPQRRSPTATGEERAPQWLTVSDAARLSAINRGVISRAADAGEISTNGKKGRERRLDSADFNRWHLERVNRPEPGESEDAIRRRMADSDD